jgi:TetR/AcrR family transcriptional regulator, cholesterol catabolism regulator
MSDELNERGAGLPAAQPSTAARLVPTAAALFRAKGYAGATTRELAELLGIHKASLYHHMSGKEELLHAICSEALRRIHGAVEATPVGVGPERRLEAMIECHVVSALEDREMHAVMLSEMRNLSPERLADVVERRDRYAALLRSAIAADQDAGRLRGDHDAKYLTLALLNLLNWTIFWYDPAGDLTPRDLARLLSGVFLDGARGPRAR